jgi:ethanolaminephosphotransferase
LKQIKSTLITANYCTLCFTLVYNPVALKLVSFLPEYLAPNIITLVGFFFTLLPCFLLFSLFSTNFSGSISSWWYYLQAFSYLSYRMLDEMDGKQARKTNNSSPLGLMFDHGCDCFTVGL